VFRPLSGGSEREGSNVGGDANEFNNCDDDRPWNVERNGGALQVHGKDFAKLTGFPVLHDADQPRLARPPNTRDGSERTKRGDEREECDDGSFYADISLLPGTLVLFHSTAVPHSVTNTDRSWRCIVEWFNELL